MFQLLEARTIRHQLPLADIQPLLLAMKVVLTGASGLIGGCILESALAHPAITHVVSLQRRLLGPERKACTSNKKLQQVIVKDFMHYEEDVLQQIKGAEACIW